MVLTRDAEERERMCVCVRACLSPIENVLTHTNHNDLSSSPFLQERGF